MLMRAGQLHFPDRESQQAFLKQNQANSLFVIMKLSKRHVTTLNTSPAHTGGSYGCTSISLNLGTVKQSASNMLMLQKFAELTSPTSPSP